MRKLLASVAAGALLALGVATPAKAAWADCGNYPGTVCLFANNNWGLPIWRQYPSQIQGCRNLTGFDNVTTMASNNTGGHYLLIMYRYLNCEGETFQLSSGSYVDFSNTWWNDKPSAVQVVAL
jgi:hypothetical protein